jgi:hypothetical protein
MNADRPQLNCETLVQIHDLRPKFRSCNFTAKIAALKKISLSTDGYELATEMKNAVLITWPDEV